jgi:hypothetical protein
MEGPSGFSVFGGSRVLGVGFEYVVEIVGGIILILV